MTCVYTFAKGTDKEITITGKEEAKAYLVANYGSLVTEVTKPQVKKTAIQSALEKVDQDIQNKGKELSAFLKSKRGTLSSGIDPTGLAIAVELCALYTKKGILKFAQFAQESVNLLFSNDVKPEEVKPYLKEAYLASKVKIDKELRSQMDKEDDVYDFDLDSIQPTKEQPTAVEQASKLEDKSVRIDISRKIADHLIGDNKFNTIVDARKFIEGITREKIEAGTIAAKRADEIIESGVVIAARDIVHSARMQGRSDKVIMDRLITLYGNQPNLSTRTSDSILAQAYSTPVPLAFAASSMAKITEDTSVYEPTAGNGMLLIAAAPDIVVANELNSDRANTLKEIMPKANVQQNNAATWTPDPTFDVVIANPPFGTVKDTEGKSTVFDVNGFKTTEIDHAISMNALSKMKEDGSAVLILGGVQAKTEEGRKDAYRGASKRSFYFNLYNNYNVVSHYSVDGDLYKKQGASYPVDVIVIKGRGKSERPLPAAMLPTEISSYEQLSNIIQENKDEFSSLEAGSGLGSDRTPAGEVASREVSERTGLVGVAEGQASGTVREGERPSGLAEESTEVPVTTIRGGERTEGGVSSSGMQRGTEGGNKSRPERVGTEMAGVSKEREGVTGNVRGDNANEVGRPSVVASPSKHVRVELQETETQVTNTPLSKMNEIGTLVPVNMRDSINNALNEIQKEHGDIDSFVAKELGMDIEDLRTRFGAEQVDSIALGISNAKNGKGFIVGSQTGIGKGRVAAAMLMYAIRQGKTPIFFTEKPNLYSDMVRDLYDIGMAEELGLLSKNPSILITNNNANVPYSIVQGDVELNYKLKSIGEEKDSALEFGKMISNNSLGNYKIIFTTYTQLQTDKNKEGNVEYKARHRLLEHFGKDNFIVFDESHNAGGNSGVTNVEDKAAQENAAGFARRLVRGASGTFFSSATYAKNPNVMDFYSSTNMMYAVESPEKLAAAISSGGVPMQQAVAAMLTKDGQYIRHERSFSGVSYETKEVEVNKDVANNMAHLLNRIFELSNKKQRAIKSYQNKLDEAAKIVRARGTPSYHVEGANFGSSMHNLISQMLLSLKADETVNMVIESVKKGEKPVIALSNTMGSFIDQYKKDFGASTGDAVNLTFKQLFERYLNKQLQIKVKSPDGSVHFDTIPVEHLEKYGLNEMLDEIRSEIEDADLGNTPISPIDYVKNELAKQGITSDEITGRKDTLDYSGGIPVLRTRNNSIKAKLAAIKGFNDGSIDVLIINQAGSTGLSIHASSKFKDKRKRHMFIMQANANIDTHMQTLGRIHRTGQVTEGPFDEVRKENLARKSRGMLLRNRQISNLENSISKIMKQNISASQKSLAVGRIKSQINLLKSNNKKEESKQEVRTFNGKPATYGLPSYTQIAADIPAENRPAAVLAKKMASLSANTTASRKSAVAAKDVVDFMNDYGGQAVAEYVIDNPGIFEMIGKDVINVAEAEDGNEETARKFTGYIPLLPIGVQEEVYEDIIERYNAIIDRENSMGTNKLEARALDLNAKTVYSEQITKDKGIKSEFAKPAIIEKVDVKKHIKPFTGKEVSAMVADNLAGEQPKDVNRRINRQMYSDVSSYIEQTREKLAKDGESAEEISKRISLIEAQRSIISNVLNSHNIGDGVSITNREGIVIHGIITNIENTKKTKNPVAGSSWKLHIALSTGESKQIVIGFNQLNGTPFTLQHETSINFLDADTNTASYVNPIDLFDKGLSVRRETRWMVTGNILSGYAVFPGQIVNYSKEDGTIAQGVMMPRGFDFERSSNAIPIQADADFAKDFLLFDGASVSTNDRAFTIQNKGGKLTVSIPFAKLRNEPYLSDRELMSIVGTLVGNSRRTELTANISFANAIKAIKHLEDHNNGLSVTGNRPKAKQLLSVDNAAKESALAEIASARASVQEEERRAKEVEQAKRKQEEEKKKAEEELIKPKKNILAAGMDVKQEDGKFYVTGNTYKNLSSIKQSFADIPGDKKFINAKKAWEFESDPTAALNKVLEPKFSRAEGQAENIDYINEDPSIEESTKIESALNDVTDGEEVANWLSKNAPSLEHRLIARSVADKLGKIKAIGGSVNFIIAHPYESVPESLQRSRGLSVLHPNSNDIDIYVNSNKVKGRVGTSYETILHELVHAATMGSIADSATSKNESAIKLNEDLDNVYAAVRDYAMQRKEEGNLTDFEKAAFAGKTNAFSNKHELISWAFANKQMQEYLEGIPYKSKNLWTAFVDAIRSFLGLSPRNETVLSEVLRLGKGFIDENPALFAKEFSTRAQETFNQTVLTPDIHEMVQGDFPRAKNAQEERKSKFSRAQGTANPTTVEDIKSVINKLFFTPKRMDSKITIVQSESELSDIPELKSVNVNSKAQAFVKGGHVYMIADNIEKGQELAVLLHELGAHIGMKNLLGDKYKVLLDQMEAFRLRNDGSIESEVAQRAYDRVQKAEGKYDAEEHLAYFIEEAVNAGIKPDTKAEGALQTWMRTLWDTMKAVLRKFGFDRADNLTAQDVVNLAYSAAGIELEETIEVDGVERSTKNSNGNPIAQDQQSLINFWRWFSPSPTQLLDGLSIAEVSRLKRDTESLADFIESQSSLPESDRFSVIPSSVLSHVSGVVNNRKILDAVVRSLPVDVVNFLGGKNLSAKEVLHDSAMLENILSVYPASNVSLGVNPAMIAELAVRVIANAGAKISGLANGALKRNSAVLADTNDSVLGAHVRKSSSGDLGIIAGFGDSKVVDEQGRPLVVYHGTTSTDITEFRPSGGVDGEWQASLDHFKNAQRNNERYGYMNFRSGSFFSPKTEYAGNYTGENKGVMYPVYIRSENPIYFDQKSGKATGVNKNKTPDALILHENGDVNEISVIDPNQIKSAIGNTGAFSKDNNDIRYSKKEVIVGASDRPYSQEELDTYRKLGRADVQESTFDKVKGAIQSKDKLKQLWKEASKKLVQGVVDQFAPIKELTMKGYILTRQAKGAAGAFSAFVRFGKLRINDGVYDADSSGGVFHKLFQPLRSELGDWTYYVAAKRAQELKNESAEAKARAKKMFDDADNAMAEARSLRKQAEEVLQQAGNFPKSMTGNQRAQEQNRKDAHALIARADALENKAAEMREEAKELDSIEREKLFDDKDIGVIINRATGDLGFDYVIKHGENKGKTTRNRREAYDDSIKELKEWNSNALDMAVQSGLIKQEDRESFESDFYIPFYRQMDDEEYKNGNVSNTILRQKAFEELKGSMRMLKADLVENMMQNWAHIIDASAKNRASMEVMNAAYLAKVAKPVMKQGYEYLGGQVYIKTKDGLVLAEDNGKLKGEYTTSAKGSVWIMEEGRKVHYTVSDPYLMTALSSMTFKGSDNFFIKAANRAKHYLTIAVTASPFFKVRNLIRDSIQAIGVATLGYDPIKNVKEGAEIVGAKESASIFMKRAIDIIPGASRAINLVTGINLTVQEKKYGQQYISMLASGALIEFGTMLEGSHSARVKQLMKEGVDGNTILDSESKIKKFIDGKIKPALEAYAELGNRGEEINRAALYTQLREKGYGHAEASYMARDLMDFSMQGAWPAIRVLTQIVPFMNARIQGLYKLGKSAKEDPARFAIVLGAVALASAALYALGMMKDPDDWKKREDWDRDNYWWFKIGGIEYRIPRPFEIGAISTIFERGADLFFRDDFTKKMFAGRMMDVLMENLSMNPVPQILKPILDVYSNKDSFSGRPIVSLGMENLSPEYRFNANTSLLARGIGTSLNTISGAVGKEALSPVQVDYLIRGYFGWLGTFIVGSSDALVHYAGEKAGVVKARPSPDWLKVFTGNFLSNADDATSGFVTRMYEQAKKIEEAHATYKDLLNKGKVEQAELFREANERELNKYRFVENIKKAESNLNKKIRLIEESDLTSSEMKEKIREINKIKNERAKVMFE